MLYENEAIVHEIGRECEKEREIKRLKIGKMRPKRI